MKLSDTCYSFINKKEIIIFSLGLIAFIFFNTPIECFLNTFFVDPLLSKTKEEDYKSLTLIVLSIVFLLSSIYRLCKRHIPSVPLALTLLFVNFIYICYRVDGRTWIFIPYNEQIKYADILLVIGVCQAIPFLSLVKMKNEPSTEEHINSFVTDKSLGKDKELKDELGYKPYAELIASKIINSSFENSFAIGINGKWGLGKTSFMDLIKRKIDEDKNGIIEIDFNPWYSHSEKAVIVDFFETLQNKLSPANTSFSSQIEKYSNKLVELNKNTLTQSIQLTSSIFSDEKSLADLKRKINKTLERLNKKIVIYIDDLDRLDSTELLEVMRLIRNTADFRNTFFVVAYDRNYVLNALEKHNPINLQNYLDKIFQLEITLPYFNKVILREKLSQLISKKWSIEDYSELHKIIKNATQIDGWLENMRDVTRLANSLLLNYSKLHGEVDFYDFIKIEVLRLKYPSVYTILFTKKDEIFTLKESHNLRLSSSYFLSNLEQNQEQSRSFEKNESHINTYLELFLVRNHYDLSISKNKIAEIVLFINNIFTEPDTPFEVKRRPINSIIFPHKFHLYFSYKLIEGVLSDVEFNKAKNKDQESFFAEIKKWVDKDLEKEVQQRFYNFKIYDCKDKHEFENIISGIFYLANLESKNNSYPTNIVGYNDRDLIEKLGDKRKLIDKFYTGEEGERAYYAFFKSLVDRAKSPYVFESGLFNEMNKLSESFSFPFTPDEMLTFNLRFFKSYCEQTKKLENPHWLLFHNCRKYHYSNTLNDSVLISSDIIGKAKVICRNFLIEKDLDGFILWAIELEMPDETRYSINDVVSSIFNSMEEFEKIILELEDEESKYLEEFKEFIKKLTNVISPWQHKHYIDFDFKVIPVWEKSRE